MMLTNSKTQQLRPQDILKIALKQTESPHDLPAAISFITREIQDPKTISLLIGNTLFIVNKSPTNKKHAFFRALNADVAANYADSSNEFVRRMGEAGFTVLVTNFKDKTLINLLKVGAKNPPFPNMGYMVQQLKGGGYQATISMGDR